jgi:protein-L-isoaspartate(D-aspartate) O-methyltransferase
MPFVDRPPPEKMMFQLNLRRRGISDQRVLRAMDDVPRDVFVEEADRDDAWLDTALGIACGQTISQPFVVAYMTERLELRDDNRVLEIGTGSGYQTTILSRLSRLVYTIERYRTLMKEAEARFQALGLTNVITRFGDGGKGWPEQAPFDRIMVTAAAPSEPKALLSQLKPTGVLVAPIGKGPVQSLRRYTGDGEGGFTVEELTDVRFVPLLDGVAKEL